MDAFVDEFPPRAAGDLSWGKRFLMCPPDYFDVSYSINVWMDAAVEVDRDRAFQQWHTLADTLRAAGAEVATIPAQPGLPDFVFTANAGLVDGDTYWPAAMLHPERQPEIPHVRRWLAEQGWNVADAPTTVQEGAGDALPFGGTLVAGYGSRSTSSAYTDLTDRAGWHITQLQLSDPRYYHVDIAFCPLDEQAAIIVPDAFTERGRSTLAELVPDPVLATAEEGAMFCANSVVVGRTVVMPACTPRLGRLLERRGFDVAICDVSEFAKAGGGCRCLTLALDVTLDRGGPVTSEVAA